MSMNFYNTAERNIQIVLRLLKEHGIKRVIASPGATDVAIVASMQHDPYFEMYSSIDERSAAYMACGMAAESGEPVVITCTGATSSRNYMPGLTEAFYRKLPVLAITCCRSNVNVGHYVDQVTDRSQLPNDIANVSVYAQTIHSPEDEWDVMIKVNKAILGLKRYGGGPCHINLATIVNPDFSVKEIAPIRVIRRYTLSDELPPIPSGRIGIFVGAHTAWTDDLSNYVDKFCSIYNAAVFCDHTSNYKGSYSVLFPLIADQIQVTKYEFDLDLVIHIGQVSNCSFLAKNYWRVNPDGEIRDTFRKMTNVFQMEELDFFKSYTEGYEPQGYETLKMEYQSEYDELLEHMPDLPFSNMWVAKQLSKVIPDHSILHLGIRNSIRSWNYFKLPQHVNVYCNTGGFGIDGGISSLIGASFVNRNQLYFGVFGDLLFYYDMNSLGNRDISSNLRILLINNGLGQEFKNYTCFGAMFGDDTDKFIAAKGHFLGNGKSVVRNYVEYLGFEYLTASNKQEFDEVYERFVVPEITERPILFEVFTDTELESEAFDMITAISKKSKIVKKVKGFVSIPELSSVKSVMKNYIKK